MRVELKFALMVAMEQCVMINGITLMLQLSVNNLASPQQVSRGKKKSSFKY